MPLGSWSWEGMQSLFEGRGDGGASLANMIEVVGWMK